MEFLEGIQNVETLCIDYQGKPLHLLLRRKTETQKQIFIMKMCMFACKQGKNLLIVKVVVLIFIEDAVHVLFFYDVFLSHSHLYKKLHHNMKCCTSFPEKLI